MDYAGRCRVSSCHHLGEIHLQLISLAPETLALQISNTSLLLSVADSLGLVTCFTGVGEVDKLVSQRKCLLRLFLSNLPTTGTRYDCRVVQSGKSGQPWKPDILYDVCSLSKLDGAA